MRAAERRTRVIAAHYARGEKTAAAPGAWVNYMRNYHFTIVNCRGKAWCALTVWEINLVWGERGENPLNRNAHSAQIHGNLLNGSSILSQSVWMRAVLQENVCGLDARKI
jgi:hypothetical protein